MRIAYAELKGKPRILKSLTGLTVSEFEALLPNFGRAWTQFVEAEFEQKKRRRAYVPGEQIRNALTTLDLITK